MRQNARKSCCICWILLILTILLIFTGESPLLPSVQFMMRLTNDAGLTIARLAPLIRRRKISPLELTRALLDRIDLVEHAINAFITVTGDLALRQARAAEKEILRGRYAGPLHGIPIHLKDLFFTRGIRTTAGSRILRSFVPEQDAGVVERLAQSGTILLGKTNLHEFAYGATNINLHYGAVRNPVGKFADRFAIDRAQVRGSHIAEGGICL